MTGQNGTGALLHATVHAASNTGSDTEQSYITMSGATRLFPQSDRDQASLVVFFYIFITNKDRTRLSSKQCGQENHGLSKVLCMQRSSIREFPGYL